MPNVVSPKIMMYVPPLPSGFTEEEIAEVNAALVREWQLQDSVNRVTAILSNGELNPDKFLGYVPNIDQL